MAPSEAPGRITAVLGPTNTGKTHLAIERMLGYASGMIGFPLRLLARENYDRIVRIKGKAAVALVTGEERILPPHPRYFVCTVEAMPLEREVDFLAVDEIQLVGDPERGHVFTERLLRARGRWETMFMGSDTARPLLRRLVPSAELVARPRFSTLTYTGPRKVTRLPPRSAVVAFAIADVFEIAELVRRQRGGTAIVMGALSPRARNAQVALYQSGEVDYMVATDAIGMGLNMDLDHVAFAKLSKFDGRGPRRLTAPEIAQIAGRAGRHMNDGTFGTTAELGPLEPELVEAVENHRFDPLKQVWWRNDELDFRSAQALLRSLEAPPPLPVMRRVAAADDQLALEALARQPEIIARATNRPAVKLLWDVCQIPDFRKVMSEHHARLLGQIWRYLTRPAERLPADWVAQQITRLDRTEGDIDALVQRIAHIRTWTYITHRPNWLDEAESWQERTRAIEDKLSDALHDRITQRFVDRRSASLVRYLAEARELMGAVTQEGEVRVEGHFVGRISGFRFTADPSAQGEEARTLLAAANRVLRQEVQSRARRLSADPDKAFALDADGFIRWHGAAVARLAAGAVPLTPRIEPLAADFLEGAERTSVRQRLERFAETEIRRLMRPLLEALEAPAEAAGRGLAFRLAEGLGTIEAAEGATLIAGLTPADRKRLARAGFRFGTETIYLDGLLKPASVALRALLWSIFHGLDLPAPVPPPGRLSIEASALPGTAYGDAIGYRMTGPRAIRADRLELLAAALRRAARAGKQFALDGALAALVAAPLGDLPAIVTALGYRGIETESGLNFAPQPRRARRDGNRPQRRPKPAASDNPFAKLRELELERQPR
ncbi:MAG TPA: helicase-related protein [Aliidongia sp.]|nr:helicase-related protein [Aliidongia sp.]